MAVPSDSIRYTRRPSYQEMEELPHDHIHDISASSDATLPEFYDTLPSLRDQPRNHSRTSSHRQSWAELMASDENLRKAATSLVNTDPTGRRHRSDAHPSEVTRNPIKLLTASMLRRGQESNVPHAIVYQPNSDLPPTGRSHSAISRDSAISTLNEFVLVPTGSLEFEKDQKQTETGKPRQFLNFIKSHLCTTKKQVALLAFAVTVFTIAVIAAVVARKHVNFPTIFRYDLLNDGTMTVTVFEQKMSFLIAEKNNAHWSLVKALADFDKNLMVFGGDFKDKDSSRQMSSRVCFAMDLNKTALPDPKSVVNAATDSFDHVHTQTSPPQFTWKPVEITQVVKKNAYLSDESMSKYCDKAKLYYLQAVHGKPDKCVCLEMCVPNLSIVNFSKDERVLTIPNLNCFYVKT